jgi:quercetin dioxygenase-like cupin family protein
MTNQAKVVNLTDAVVPATDGITSRTVYEDERLKAVMFGFGMGQEMSEHSSSKVAIMHFLSGEADVTLAADRLTATAGTWVHMAAGLSHSIAAKTDLTMLLLLLK